MAVTQIMDADALHPCGRRGTVELPIEGAVTKVEYALVWPNFIEGADVLLHLVI